ncbi:MAG: septation protein SepH, partial [Actinocatenispora sp.]
MRPVRFVALSEDGQALVLADEVGRLLTLPIDDRIGAAVRHERSAPRGQFSGSSDPVATEAALSPRDIQSRIRSGESAEEVARIAGVPVDRVLRYAGPVLQERAMLAQHARRTRLRSSDRGATLAEIVDARLAQHGVDADGVSWDAYRRDDGTWRVTASWASGKATAQAIWALDKARQVVTADDDMAQFLSTERPAPLLGQEPAPDRATARGGHALSRPEAGRSREAARPTHGSGHGLPSKSAKREPTRRLGEVARSTLDRPLHQSGRPTPEPLFSTERTDSGRPDVGGAPGRTPA